MFSLPPSFLFLCRRYVSNDLTTLVQEHVPELAAEMPEIPAKTLALAESLGIRLGPNDARAEKDKEAGGEISP